MNTISCIVVDDEPLAVRLMESYAAKTPFLSLKGIHERNGCIFISSGQSGGSAVLRHPDAEPERDGSFTDAAGEDQDHIHNRFQ